MDGKQSRREFLERMMALGLSFSAAALLLEACETTTTVVSTAVMTPFTPEANGFKFVNDFTNDFVPALDIHTNGLCGGMSYTALDYYNAKRPIPNEPYRPANGTALEHYLYNRQVDSIESNLDKWTELGFNPGGARDSEFFHWGLLSTARIAELRAAIDHGTPVVLGLQGAGSEGSHQTIAFGYDLGRYKGDLGDFITDFKIFICDPNYAHLPGDPKPRTLIPDVPNKVYRYQEGGNETWRAYFVDTKYQAKAPPNLPNPNYPADGLVHELRLQFFTGADDLNGGDKNVDVIVNFLGSPPQVFPNVNQSARWIANYDQTVAIVLQTPVRLSAMQSIVISTNFPGGLFGENWDMARLDIIAVIGSSTTQPIKTAVGPMRFTGDVHTMTIPLP